MPIKTCSRCQKKFSYSKFGGSDYVHECHSGKEVLDEEDVTLLGNWSDYTGTGTAPKSIVQAAGIANKLQGTDAYYEDDAHQGDLTVRGKHKATHRQRAHHQHIELVD